MLAEDVSQHERYKRKTSNVPGPPLQIGQITRRTLSLYIHHVVEENTNCHLEASAEAEDLLKSYDRVEAILMGVYIGAIGSII